MATTPKIQKKDLIQTDPLIFINGEKKNVSILIQQVDDYGNIVAPTTLTITNEAVNIYLCTNLTLALVTDVPVKTDVFDVETGLIKIGVKLTYSVDTSLLSGAGSYVLIFSYDRDSIEKRITPVYINVSDMTCVFNNSTC